MSLPQQRFLPPPPMVLVQFSSRSNLQDCGHPIAYASHAMTPTEQCYSQIEKEALALVWACENFSTFVIGKRVMLETDHKPLVPLMGQTNLDCLPPCILHFRICLMRFDYSIIHVPGKSLHAADALSCAPISGPSDLHSREANQTESFVDNIVSSLPADPDRLLKYCDAQRKDDVCSRVIAFCKKGWPMKEQLSRDMLPYWRVRGELTLCRDLLLRGKRIVVPASLRTETLEKIHSGHQGIQRCLLRITSAVWWPQVKHEIEQLVQNCPTCTKASVPQRQPMIASELPTHPWEKVASDLFYLNGKTYILVADYFSRYLEVQSMSSTTSGQTVQALKAIFSRHGIPTTFVSDNASEEMVAFAREYNFTHITSSPHYPQGNGFAERMVRTAKSLLSKSPSDPYLALLTYRCTPMPWCGLSPSELLMGRQLRSNIPQHPSVLTPEWPYLTAFREKDQQLKQQEKSNYDKRHRVRSQPPLAQDEAVWVRTQNHVDPGHVVQPAATPRSYIIQTPSAMLRRNKSHLTRQSGMTTDQADTATTNTGNNDQHRVMTRSQTGANVGPPSRLAYWRKGDVVCS